jgi:hypothetical protein
MKVPHTLRIDLNLTHVSQSNICTSDLFDVKVDCLVGWRVQSLAELSRRL